MIKPLKKKSEKDKMSMQELQTNLSRSADQMKCEKDPLYFYNKYIRGEGQPILTQEEYDKEIKIIEECRNKIDDKVKFNEYPLTPNEVLKTKDNE